MCVKVCVLVLNSLMHVCESVCACASSLVMYGVHSVTFLTSDLIAM